MIEDEIVAFDPAVDCGDGFERFHSRFNEEGHEPELESVIGLEFLLRFFAECDDFAHVALVKSGEDGSGLLRHDELGGNLASQRRHFLAGKTLFPRQRRLFARRFLRAAGFFLVVGRDGSGRRLEMGEHVALR